MTLPELPDGFEVKFVFIEETGSSYKIIGEKESFVGIFDWDGVSSVPNSYQFYLKQDFKM